MQLIPQINSPHVEGIPMHRVGKGWGHEVWVVNDSYCGKLLYFQEGKRCSWHYHKVKDEVFFLQSGKVIVRFSYGDSLELAQSVVLVPGMSFRVPVGLRHQMEAVEDSVLFEFSTHHEDEDSIRLIKGD